MKTSSVAALVIFCAQGCSSVRQAIGNVKRCASKQHSDRHHSNESSAFNEASVLDFHAPAGFRFPKLAGRTNSSDEGWLQQFTRRLGEILGPSPARGNEQNCSFDDTSFEVVTTGLGMDPLMRIFRAFVLPVVRKNVAPLNFHVTHFDGALGATRVEVDHCVKHRNFNDADLILLRSRVQPYVLFDLANIFLYTQGGVVDRSDNFTTEGGVNALYLGFLPNWGRPLLKAFRNSDFRLFDHGGQTYVNRILAKNDWSSFPVNDTLTGESRPCHCAGMPELPSKCWENMNNDFCFYMFQEGRVFLGSLVKAYACANNIDINSEARATRAFDEVSAWLWA